MWLFVITMRGNVIRFCIGRLGLGNKSRRRLAVTCHLDYFKVFRCQNCLGEVRSLEAIHSES